MTYRDPGDEARWASVEKRLDKLEGRVKKLTTVDRTLREIERSERADARMERWMRVWDKIRGGARVAASLAFLCVLAGVAIGVHNADGRYREECRVWCRHHDAAYFDHSWLDETCSCISTVTGDVYMIKGWQPRVIDLSVFGEE